MNFSILDIPEGPGGIFHRFGFNWNTVMRKVNEAYDHPSTLSTTTSSPAPTYKMLFPSSRSEILGNRMQELVDFNLNPVAGFFHLTECKDQVQAITLAMLLYEKQHGTLPPAWTVDKEGKPLHSWRVLLLPYLGEAAKKLSKKIRLDEPWGSAHNRQFQKIAVPFYQCPATELKPGQTIYTVVVGKKTAFRGSEGTKLSEFGPNSANLLLITERKTPVCWMKPDDEVTEGLAHITIGNPHPNDLIIGFRSGVVKCIHPSAIILTAPPLVGEDDNFEQNLPQLLDGTAERVSRFSDD